MSIRHRKQRAAMGRIAETFARLRIGGSPGLVTYVTAGDPDAARSEAIVRTLDRAGADLIEIGIPFSDPLADGPVIQRATERAMAAGTTLRSSLELIERVRGDVRAPMVVFTYANPVLAMGTARFLARAAAAGVDGVLVLDLPIEEAEAWRDATVEAGIDPIFLLSPTTIEARMRRAAELGRGFLYAISRLGVTGERDTIAASAQALVERIRSVTDLPVAVGFGISRPEHVAAVSRWADAAVVGSGIVRTIAEAQHGAQLEEAVAAYVRWLKHGVAEPRGIDLRPAADIQA